MSLSQNIPKLQAVESSLRLGLGLEKVHVMKGPEHLSLRVPNVKFNFHVSVDSIQLQTDTSKSNSMLKWGLIIACKWVFNVVVMSKTKHRTQIRCTELSVIDAYDLMKHQSKFLPTGPSGLSLGLRLYRPRMRATEPQKCLMLGWVLMTQN